MVNVKFPVEWEWEWMRMRMRMRMRHYVKGINESHCGTGNKGASQEEQDALTSFLWGLCGWNEESADEGGQASSRSPLPLPPLPPWLSDLIIGDNMNLDKNLSIDCEKCAINAYCTSQNWGDDDLPISHQSSCPQMSNPQSLTSCACRRPKTCWLPCACERRVNEGLIQEGCNGSCKAFWLFYTVDGFVIESEGNHYVGMLYSGVILKQATTALRRCLDSSLCHTIFFDLKGCSVWSKKQHLLNKSF